MTTKSETEVGLIQGSDSAAAASSSAAAIPEKEPETRKCYMGKAFDDYVNNCKATKKKPQEFCNNEITTSKYNLFPLSLRFIVWRNLYEQLHRAANLYFLIVGIIQIIPNVSPTGRWTTIAPLSLVMFLSMIKDAYEDYKRHVADHELNSAKAIVWQKATNSFGPVKWQDIHVGDLIQLKNKEDFPADIIIIWTTEPGGLCFIETAQLDGETNLKIRKAVPETAEIDKNGVLDVLGSLNTTISYEMPNDRLYKFDGNMTYQGKTVALNNDNVFLRGSQLRNTEIAYGIVAYTGSDTKLMQNALDKRHKMSNLDRLTNRQVLYIFIFQLFIGVVSMIGLAIMTVKLKDHWYLAYAPDLNVAATTFLGFLTFLILFNNLIPISLYVSMEMVKLVQASLINNDVQMYYAPADMPANARTSALNEELGQIRFIFSDKTGTLTCNMMDFIKFSCMTTSGAAISYGAGVTEIARAAAAREGRILVDPRPANFQGKDGFCFYDPKVVDMDGRMTWIDLPNRPQVEEFIRHLAVCHTVIAEYAQDRKDFPNQIAAYQAASPDEGCLVKAARELGIIFDTRTEKTCTVSFQGKLETYQVLNIIEFNSARKRMSIIVRTPQGKLQLLCKGADSVIYERLLKQPQTDQLHTDTLKMLTTFAAEGLRTLVLAKADLNEAFYAEWAAKYEKAGLEVNDREEKMAEVGEEIEKNLVLVGSTAIEDKLQDQVPQTIELAISAGIKVWVLTGDKQETAINIGYACALLHNAMTIWTFDESPEGVPAKIAESKQKADENLNSEGGPPNDMALVIQGGHLSEVLGKDVPKRDSLAFLDLAVLCKSVICCRVSPLQKAMVVLLVRENVPQAITLSIGDGANDVPMIVSADVGVGIAGVEGLQAARSSDYSIGQFKYLQRLLLVHGRWNYRRISKLILYSFYKNMVLYLSQFWFCMFNGFSGQSLYDNWALATYNVWYTAFPIMVLASFDQDVPADRLLSMDQFPDLYMDGISNRLFNSKYFITYIFNAVIHSLLAFFFSVFCLTPSFDATIGIDMGIGSAGVLTYSVVVGIVTVKISLETLSWTWLHVWFVLGSIAMWFFFMFIYGSIYGTVRGNDFAVWYDVPHQVWSTGVCWLIVLVCTTASVIRDFAFKAYRRNFNPELSHVIQVLEGQRKTRPSFTFDRTYVSQRPQWKHLLGQLDNLEPKTGIFNFSMPKLSMMTGYAFSQEEGQADITMTLSRKFDPVDK